MRVWVLVCMCSASVGGGEYVQCVCACWDVCAVRMWVLVRMRSAYVDVGTYVQCVC